MLNHQPLLLYRVFCRRSQCPWLKRGRLFEDLIELGEPLAPIAVRLAADGGKFVLLSGAENIVQKLGHIIA